MFRDPTIVGSWPTLIERLDSKATLRFWAAAEPALSGMATVEDLLATWSRDLSGDHTDAILAALVRLAAVDGGADDDALLLTLQLLSGLVWGLARQLRDLSPDVLAVIVAELTCQIRRYPWRRRPVAIAANLRVDTRQAVLADLLPRDRRHPGSAVVLTADGDLTRFQAPGTEPQDDIDLADLLEWAVRSGIDAADIDLLIATEFGRADGQRRSDRQVAAAHGITTRTLYRRRHRTLTALRSTATEYLAAIA